MGAGLVSLADFLQNLESGDSVRCVKAAEQAYTLGLAAQTEAARVAADASQPDRTRYWALQIASGLRSADRDLLVALATSALRDRYSGVRVVAISVLANIKPLHAVEAISGLLNDDGIDPTWWTEPPSKVREAAVRALESIGTPAAMEALEKAGRG